MSQDVLEAALRCAAAGWRVFPVWWPLFDENGECCGCACGYQYTGDAKEDKRHPTGKHPCADLAPEGHHSSTCDEATIRSWFDVYPDINLGLDLDGSGLVAIDVDFYHGDLKKLADLQERYGDLPVTTEQMSGSGDGGHLIFQPPPHPIRGQLGGITLRGNNYLVIAPSLHKSGGRYTWESAPWERAPAALSTNWQAAIKKPEADLGSVGVPDEEEEWLKAVAQDERVRRMRDHLVAEKGETMGVDPPGTCFNVTRTAARGFAVRDPDQVLIALKDLYNSKCVPPYSDEKLSNIVWKAYEQAHTPEWGAKFEPALEKTRRLRLALGDKSALSDDGPISAPADLRSDLLAVAQKLSRSQDGAKITAGRVLSLAVRGQPIPTDIGENRDQAIMILIEAAALGAPRASAVEIASLLLGAVPEFTPDDFVTLIEHKRGGLGEDAVAEVDSDDELRAQLDVTEKGEPKASPKNIELVLSKSQTTRGTFRYDDVAKKVHAHSDVFSGVDENSLPVAVNNWLSRKWHINTKSSAVAEQIAYISQQEGNKYDPLADYLRSLQWDEIPRLDDWLISYCDAVTRDEDGNDITEYVRTVGSKWLLGAVARGLDPGCKMDNVLVLEGQQGARKSTVPSILAGGWFTDTPVNPGDKDSRIRCARFWMAELAELVGIMKTETESQKAFLSGRVDHVRPPYGRSDIEFKRRCVFIGTMNPQKDGSTGYLQDLTGNRRWWPVRVGRANLQALRRDRDKLLAEAVARYELGKDLPQDETRPANLRWWLEDDENLLAEREAEKRLAEDAWVEVILRWAKAQTSGKNSLGGSAPARDSWTLQEVAIGALRLDPAALKRFDRQVGDALRRAGFTKRKERRDGAQLTIWRHPEFSVEPAAQAVDRPN